MVTLLVISALCFTLAISVKKRGDWWALFFCTVFVGLFAMVGAGTQALSGADEKYVSHDGTAVCVRETELYDPSWFFPDMKPYERAFIDSAVVCEPIGGSDG